MKTAHYHGYTIHEDGTIIGLHGREIKKRIHNGRYEIRLRIKDKRINYILPRLLYYLFIGFDLTNKNLCITPIDGNHLNISLDNLQLTHRKDLIQGEKHKAMSKITDEEAENIRQIYKGKACVNQYDKSGISLQDLADQYGVTKGNIKMIVSGQSRNKDEYKLK